MPYVLGKVKRTVAGDPVADLADVEDAVTALAAKAAKTLSNVTQNTTVAAVVKALLELLSDDDRLAGSAVKDISADQVTSDRLHIDRFAWTGTQAEYDDLTDKDDNTLYFITG